jgi:regulator of protease activity HflC (stomatin/prohibitin superfamily)
MARSSSSHIHIPIGMYSSERADIRFGKEFTTAVEQKQIAQQDAERAKFVVEKAEQERQAAVIRAEGEAEAANTISKALNRAGDAFVQFRKIEAAREIGTCFFLFPPSTLLPL